jgi:asparagine synthase (glutamine-hydrolysing)
VCGIAGIYGGHTDALDGMLDCIPHRGPDDTGRFVDGTVPVSMGAQRLSIVGLESGSQPVTNEDGSVVVVFNGEIYNYPELREDLVTRGHTFRTNCDTEVLVHLWEEYGETFPERLNGMFAFSLWDRDRETLFLARDRLGIKPLYVAQSDEQVVWGSEIPAVLAAGVDRTIDERVVYNYFSLRYSPWPRTLFDAIEKIPPGTSLCVSDGGIDRRRYWQLEATSTDMSRRSAVERTRSLLETAVERRLMADVPVGAFLSGGLDSTAIVGLLSEKATDPVQTFSVGFQGDQYDESSEAQWVADQFGTDHTEITVDLSSMDVFGDVVRHFGEPLADAAMLPTAMLARRASESLKVVLTGEGADELFAGYDEFRRVPQDRRRFGWLPKSAFRLADVAEWATPVGEKYFRHLASLNSDEDAILSWTRGYGTLPEAYLDTDESPDTSGLRDFVREACDEDASDTLQRLSAFYIRHWLVDDLLYKIDHTTMAASLEARVPFLDHELVEFVYNAPSEYKLDGSYKPLLNSAVSDVVPDRIRSREKHGFRVPIDRWFREDHEAIEGWLTEERVSAVPYVDADRVFDLLSEHRRERADNRSALWKILNYVAWYHVHARGEAGQMP